MQSQAGGNPEEIITTYKRMMAECQQIAQKINEVRVGGTTCVCGIRPGTAVRGVVVVVVVVFDCAGVGDLRINSPPCHYHCPLSPM
jgi:hypothetical protein